MTRRNPPAKWVLPLVTRPATSTCVMVQVPDDPFHRAAFKGAILDLASAYKWQDDPTHQAREVALVWRDIFDNLEFCPPATGRPDGISLEDMLSTQIRISPDDPCIIQMWCIDHWEDWYDPRTCITVGASQSGPQSPPALGDCRSYPVTLNARDQWLLPSPVSAGDIITVSGAAGGWNDGTLGWNCPSGQVYFGGVCGADEAGEVTDPMPSVNHMRLIGQVGTSGDYFDAYAGAYSVPVGVSGEQLTLQANDSSLADNQGSISFTVEICTQNPTTWTSTFVFGVSSYGGIITVLNGAWDGANGFIGTPAGGQFYTCNLQLDLPARDLKSMKMTYTSGGGSGGSDGVAFYADSAFYGSLGPIVAGSHETFEVIQATNATQLLLSMGTGTTNSPCWAEQWEIVGYGTKPAGFP